MVGNLGLNANPKRAGRGRSRRGRGACPLPCGAPGGLPRGGAEALSRGAHSSGAPPRAAPGTSKTTTNQALQFVFRIPPIGLEIHSKVPPCSRVGPLLQPAVFVACFIGWRPAAGVVCCFVSGGLNRAFPFDKHVCVSDT